MRWEPVNASCISPCWFGSLDKTQKLLRVLGHFPRVSWLLQRPVPTRLLFNIDFWETGNLPGLQYIYPKCSEQVNNRALMDVWEYRTCSIVFFLLLSVFIVECPYVPVDADLMQVGPWGVGASRGSRLCPGSSWGHRSIPKLPASPGILSLAICTGAFLSVEVGSGWICVQERVPHVSSAACVAGCGGPGPGRGAHPAQEPYTRRPSNLK